MALASIERDTRRLKEAAVDAVEDGMHAARRAIESARHYADELGDLKDEAAHQVKRRPLQMVGAALSVGLVLGAVMAWIVIGPRRRW